MAHPLIEFLRPDPLLLIVAVLLDSAIGDPPYPFHPVRVIGRTLAWIEAALRRLGADGYGGGVALLVVLSIIWIPTISVLVVASASVHPWAGSALHVFFLYSLLALGDLVRHVWRVERAVARNDLAAAREAIGRLVGRDTAPMDGAACRRAAIESLAESLTDGFVSPVFWYTVAGVPGLVLFKIVSTMDSMVGYKSARYFRFGWCGARVDDVMNWVPARLSWVLIIVATTWLPGYSTLAAVTVGWQQHGILPGPNAGWSEAAAAGALRRRLVGPVWREGNLVTDVWIGRPADPPAGERGDVRRAIALMVGAGLVATIAMAAAMAML